jgi:8-oxo-dGTP pyrophosphatase MutT (NUDIX family)
MKSNKKSATKPRTQYATLPWRLGPDGAPEILLITSRETRRWVIPKGWPIKNLTPPQAAAREAFEEAGVEGEVATTLLGSYRYDKQLSRNKTQSVIVQIFALRVALEHLKWPEMAEREKRWMSAAEAAQLVDEPELRALIAGLDPAVLSPLSPPDPLQANS